MNHDDKTPDTRHEISRDLEARIVAWVAGEASAFEAAELERLAGERPEIADFKRRIQATHSLLSEAVRADKAPLQFAPERRAKLLQAIGVVDKPESVRESNPPVYLSPGAARRKRQREFQWMLAAASCLALCVFLLMRFVGPNNGTLLEQEKAERIREDLGSRRKVFAESDGSVRRNEVEYKAQADSQAFAAEREQRARNAVRVEMPTIPEDADADVSGGATLGVVVPNATYTMTLPPMSPPAGGVIQRKLPAQAISPSPAPSEQWATDEVRMEPFEVTASEDKGYTATSTLAGTRVRTDMKDVSSSISVVTEQFLKDTGAKNSRDLLTYTSNTELAGQAGNFSAGKKAPSRVSGLDWADQTGDFGQAALPVQTAPSGTGAIGGKAETSSTGNLADDQPKLAVIDALEPRGGATNSEAKKSEAAHAAAIAGDERLPKPVTRTAIREDTFAEVSANKDPVSTFSLHVSDASFRLAEASLARGEAPDPDSIRPEEFYNAFDYGDPAPAESEKIACRIEQAAHPFLQQRNLVRIAMRVPASGRSAGQPLRLTVLLDTSGSMEREDRAAAVRRAFEVLVSLLGPEDRLTLIGFARQPRLLAESVHGDQTRPLLNLVEHIPAEGGTNFEEALKLGNELAHRQFAPQAQNRIVLLTDGAANLGDADPAKLAVAVEAMRQQQISFDACGVGTDGLDDAMLEALTRKGGGRYSILDTPESADAGFARQLAGAFRPAADNVKVQVRFNPARVGSYRLIGFEHHRLRAEDFRNDQVAAAQLAAEEAAVALYQVEVLPQGEGELGEVYVRFRDLTTGTMVERSWTMMNDPQALAFDQATPTMQLAGTAALLAEKLRGGAGAAQIKLRELAPVVNALHGRYRHEARVQELITMFGQIRRISGE